VLASATKVGVQPGGGRAGDSARVAGTAGYSSDVTQPPVSPARLQRCDPAAKRIDACDDRNPQQVNPGQADAKTLWKEAVVSKELLGGKSLRNTQQDCKRVNEIEMRDVERQRRSSVGRQCV